MKIQNLAIIFVIIILPISIVLSAYTQKQIQTINTQTLYDAKLTSATYDAIKAYQLNAQNSTTSELANSKIRDIEASVATFRNSIKSAFRLNGYSEEDIDNYIPALVYTMYDGFYIYSPYQNINHQYDDNGNKIQGNEENIYGLKPYVTYSCRYKTTEIDVVITYTLDNYITVQGTINGNYVNDGGYLIDGITINGEDVYYNSVKIEKERLKEYFVGSVEYGIPAGEYPYVKLNGTKYYLINDEIIYLSNGTIAVQCKKTSNYPDDDYGKYEKLMNNNNQAIQYYKNAQTFTEWFRSKLGELRWCDAYIEVIQDDGTVVTTQMSDDTTKIFNSGLTHIENELSNFNQHRLAVIRKKIEANLAIAIANYNAYSKATTNEFQMPELKEDEWDYIIHNISLISFLQGLNIGGKIYNGYTIVTNSESEEVVLEPNIYILGDDGAYHRIGDKGLERNRGVNVADNEYGGKISAGRLNLDFKRKSVLDNNNSRYYYPLQNYNASYKSIVIQDEVTTYEDIYAYVEEKLPQDVQLAFYTALGRERICKYNSNNTISVDTLLASAGSEETGGIDPEPNPDPITYTITYDANGGTGAPQSQTKHEGESITLSTTEPTKTGYTFLGWATTSTATSAEYSAGGTYIADASVRLYAVWKAKTYTLEFNGNGGIFTQSTGNGVLQLQGIPYETQIPTSVLGYIPTKSGYTFKGWATTSTATTPLYVLGDTVTVTSNQTLYAVWQSNTSAITDPVTITFNLNGGTGGPSSITVQKGTIVTLPIITPVKPGYTFGGWMKPMSMIEPVVYKPGAQITVNQNITLYAKWNTGGEIM